MPEYCKRRHKVTIDSSLLLGICIQPRLNVGSYQGQLCFSLHQPSSQLLFQKHHHSSHLFLQELKLLYPSLHLGKRCCPFTRITLLTSSSVATLLMTIVPVESQACGLESQIQDRAYELSPVPSSLGSFPGPLLSQSFSLR